MSHGLQLPMWHHIGIIGYGPCDITYIGYCSCDVRCATTAHVTSHGLPLPMWCHIGYYCACDVTWATTAHVSSHGLPLPMWCHMGYYCTCDVTWATTAHVMSHGLQLLIWCHIGYYCTCDIIWATTTHVTSHRLPLPMWRHMGYHFPCDVTWATTAHVTLHHMGYHCPCDVTWATPGRVMSHGLPLSMWCHIGYHCPCDVTWATTGRVTSHGLPLPIWRHMGYCFYLTQLFILLCFFFAVFTLTGDVSIHFGSNTLTKPPLSLLQCFGQDQLLLFTLQILLTPAENIESSEVWGTYCLLKYLNYLISRQLVCGKCPNLWQFNIFAHRHQLERRPTRLNIWRLISDIYLHVHYPSTALSQIYIFTHALSSVQVSTARWKITPLLPCAIGFSGNAIY